MVSDMGAIKDIVDLAKDLESRAKDRKDMELINKIQALALSLQSHEVEVVERDIRVMEENSELKRQLSEWQVEEIRIHRMVEFRRGKRTDGKPNTLGCPSSKSASRGSPGLDKLREAFGVRPACWRCRKAAAVRKREQAGRTPQTLRAIRLRSRRAMFLC
jgi:hypothetical protein